MIARLNESGYIVEKNALSTELMISSLIQLAHLYAPERSRLPKKQRINIEQAHHMAFSSYIEQGKTCPELRSRKYDVSACLPAVASILKELEPKIRRVVGNKYIVTKCQFRFDDFTGSRSLGLHQEVYGMLSDATITTWVPMCETNKTRGGLAVIPGSNKLGLIPHAMQPNASGLMAHGIAMDSINEEQLGKPLVLSTSPGDAIMFNPYLIHGTSLPELEEINRITFICRADPIDRIDYLHNVNASQAFISQE